MRTLATGVAAVCLVVLAACGKPTNDDGGNGGDGRSPSPGPEPSAVTLETVGGEDWPVGEEGYTVPPPSAPSGFVDGDVAELATILVQWSQATSLDPSVFTASDPGTFALRPLPEFTTDSLLASAEEVAIPELSFANVWGEIADYDDPRITIGWEVEALPEAADDGGPMLVVTLQSRAVYPVTTRAGEETLIGVIRWHVLASLGERGESGMFTASAGWAVAGTDPCALLQERKFIPATIADHAEDEYERIVEAMNAEGAYQYPYDDSEDVNSPEFQAECGTDGA